MRSDWTASLHSHIISRFPHFSSAFGDLHIWSRPGSCWSEPRGTRVCPCLKAAQNWKRVSDEKYLSSGLSDAIVRIRFYQTHYRSYLKNLKAVNVQNADVELLLLLLHGFINALIDTQSRNSDVGSSKVFNAMNELTSTRKSNSRVYSALDRASLVKHACSVFRVTEMDSVFPPHLLSMILLVSLQQRPS